MWMSDSDDDKPIISLIQKRIPVAKPVVKAERVEDRPAKKAKTEDRQGSSKAEVKREKEGKDDKASRSSRPSSSSGSGATAAKKSIAFYEDTQKGMLVQRLLVRWWYAIEWPRKEEIGQAPEGYEALKGFPGVFISTRSESLGTILDLRNKANCPSLRNLSQWPCSELQAKCALAYEKQMQLLAESEGEDCKLYRILKAELREVRRVDCDKADKEAKKISFT